jgi:hypothetical protein
MKTTLLYFLAFLTFTVQVIGQTVTASWDTNPEPTVSGYRVLYGTNSQRYVVTNTVVGRMNTNLVLQTTNVPTGVSYWVVQAYLTNGLTSPNSYEIMWTNAPPVVPSVPPSAPRGFRLSANLQAGRSPVGPWTNLAHLAVPMPLVDNQRFFRTHLLLEDLP